MALKKEYQIDILNRDKMYYYSLQDSSRFLVSLKVDGWDRMSLLGWQTMESLNLETIRKKDP